MFPILRNAHEYIHLALEIWREKSALLLRVTETWRQGRYPLPNERWRDRDRNSIWTFSPYSLYILNFISPFWGLSLRSYFFKYLNCMTVKSPLQCKDHLSPVSPLMSLGSIGLLEPQFYHVWNGDDINYTHLIRVFFCLENVWVKFSIDPASLKIHTWCNFQAQQGGSGPKIETCSPDRGSFNCCCFQCHKMSLSSPWLSAILPGFRGPSHSLPAVDNKGVITLSCDCSAPPQAWGPTASAFPKHVSTRTFCDGGSIHVYVAPYSSH